MVFSLCQKITAEYRYSFHHILFLLYHIVGEIGDVPKERDGCLSGEINLFEKSEKRKKFFIGGHNFLFFPVSRRW